MTDIASFASLLNEPFQFEFMRVALGVSLALAVVGGGLGLLLANRGLSMLGDGLAHTTLAGVGLALLFGFGLSEATYVALPFTVGMAVFMVILGRRERLSMDSVLGVLFTSALAIGLAAVHVAAKSGRSVDLETILFGNLLGVQQSELSFIFVSQFVLVAGLVVFGRRIAMTGFYPELAMLHGLSPLLHELILMSMVGIWVVIAAKTVGVLLVSAWLVLPALVGRLWSIQFGVSVLVSVLSSLFGSFAGLLLSFYFDIPAGASITLVCSCLFLMALCWSHAAKARQRDRKLEL